ncbi:hypothetical protein EW145_g3392 [Phellinidium pouzarii]|uniref:Uncharacterized protein n=1 Tax=Phellinidium pouzarii TaxID=167371 RepID=A0A4S4LCL6_9AGAM|nr:hypothetical protein EW145_g3392 [Phellinidium pouzarii]
MSLNFAASTARITYNLQSKASQDLPTRSVPAYYSNEHERWTLLESGWDNYAWDLTSEEERAFARGELPPGAFIPNHVADSLREQEKMNADAQAASLLDPVNQTTSQAAPPISQAAPPIIINEIQISERTHGFHDMPKGIELIPFEHLPDPAVNPEEYIKNFFPPSTLPAPSPPAVVAPKTPQRARPYAYNMATPELSPSISVYSEADTDWEPELEGDAAQTPTALRAGIQVTVSEPHYTELDTNLFAKPTPAGYPLPPLHASPSSPKRAPWTKNPAWDSQYSLPISPNTSRNDSSSSDPFRVPTDAHTNTGGDGSSSAGPSRIPMDARTQRKENAKPYSRKAKGKNAQPSTLESNLRCPECNYVQARGAGDQRSFRRHMETHPRYKKMKWGCMGTARMYILPASLMEHSVADAKGFMFGRMLSSGTSGLLLSDAYQTLYQYSLSL